MTVKEASARITQVKELCDKIINFDIAHPELDRETGFMVDVTGVLCDYRKLLENQIEKAELNI